MRKTFIIPHQKHAIPHKRKEIATLFSHPSTIAVVKDVKLPVKSENAIENNDIMTKQTAIMIIFL